MQTYKELYIGGEWVAPDGSEVIEVISPATEEVIGQVPHASTGDADRAVAARFDVISATNTAAAIQDERAFLEWIADHQSSFPDAYRTIKEANLGLVELSDPDAETLESGANQCAVM